MTEDAAASEERSLKMRELEQETGVGRETIRFYLREGLLPEPERPKRNVARYSQIHVDRLKAIKRLQQERFLPLNVIKTIMKAQDAETAGGIGGFIGLENALYPLLGDPKNLEPRKLEQVAEEAGLGVDEVHELVQIGFVQPDTRDGAIWLDSRNARIVSLWRQIKDAGFTEELGYSANEWRVYAEFLDWLVREEVTTFYEKLAERVGQSEAATMASEGVRVMNEMLPLMRADRVVRAVADISARGELPRGPDTDESES
jgi:DNA-binding transcriptional MerR regulator